MRVRVDFKFSEGNDESSFVIDTSTAKAKNQLHQDLLDAIQRALLDPDKTANFRTYFDDDFYSDIVSKGRSSDEYVTIWYW